MSEEASPPIITTKHLNKMYGPHLAIDDINLEIPKGAIGILGPNGAGKTTCFYMIVGLVKQED